MSVHVWFSDKSTYRKTARLQRAEVLFKSIPRYAGAPRSLAQKHRRAYSLAHSPRPGLAVPSCSLCFSAL